MNLAELKERMADEGDPGDARFIRGCEDAENDRPRDPKGHSQYHLGYSTAKKTREAFTNVIAGTTPPQI